MQPCKGRVLARAAGPRGGGGFGEKGRQSTQSSSRKAPVQEKQSPPSQGVKKMPVGPELEKARIATYKKLQDNQTERSSLINTEFVSKVFQASISNVMSAYAAAPAQDPSAGAAAAASATPPEADPQPSPSVTEGAAAVPETPPSAPTPASPQPATVAEAAPAEGHPMEGSTEVPPSSTGPAEHVPPRQQPAGPHLPPGGLKGKGFGGPAKKAGGGTAAAAAGAKQQHLTPKERELGATLGAMRRAAQSAPAGAQPRAPERLLDALLGGAPPTPPQPPSPPRPKGAKAAVDVVMAESWLVGEEGEGSGAAPSAAPPGAAAATASGAAKGVLTDEMLGQLSRIGANSRKGSEEGMTGGVARWEEGAEGKGGEAGEAGDLGLPPDILQELQSLADAEAAERQARAVGAQGSQQQEQRGQPQEQVNQPQEQEAQHGVGSEGAAADHRSEAEGEQRGPAEDSAMGPAPVGTPGSTAAEAPQQQAEGGAKVEDEVLMVALAEQLDPEVDDELEGLAEATGDVGKAVRLVSAGRERFRAAVEAASEMEALQEGAEAEPGAVKVVPSSKGHRKASRRRTIGGEWVRGDRAAAAAAAAARVGEGSESAAAAADHSLAEEIVASALEEEREVESLKAQLREAWAEAAALRAKVESLEEQLKEARQAAQQSAAAAHEAQRSAAVPTAEDTLAGLREAAMEAAGEASTLVSKLLAEEGLSARAKTQYAQALNKIVASLLR